MSVPANRRRVRRWYADLETQIPEELTPLEAVQSIKCIDSSGEVCLLNIKTDALNTWEAIGMLVSCQDDMRQRLMAPCEEEDD